MRFKTFWICCGVLVAQPLLARAGAYMWGIDDSNNIIEYNPELDTSAVVLQTGLTAEASSNGMGFDAVNRDVFFGYGGLAPSAEKGIYVWRQGTDEVRKIATLEELGTSSEPTNAFFHDGYYWFILDETNILRRCRVLYDPTSAFPVGIDSPEEIFLDIPPTMINREVTGADIALDAPRATVYGILTTAGGLAHPVLFRVDLRNIETTNNVPLVIIDDNVEQSMQLAFDTSYETLYGVRDTNFTTIDKSTGKRTTLLLGTDGLLIRDLAGASSTSSMATKH